ncbi:MAG TPA: TMEM175 family protein [Candidatus Dormibacteraeota bacterium]|nr:TMEM175 family protein [Candidatus Dormibacteraeota bacterium]
MPPGLRRYNELAGTDIGRLAGISDGIFAVGMTLLVLGLGVQALSGRSTTESELWDFLRGLGPSFLVYTLSFMTLGIFWVGQGSQMSQLVRSNRHYSWIHLAFLFAVTLVPFSTALLAHFWWLKVALVEYWLNIVLLGFMLLFSAEYGIRAHLFPPERERDVVRLIRGRVWIAQVLYALAVALSVVFQTTLVSIAGILLIQLNYVLAPRIPFLERF